MVNPLNVTMKNPPQKVDEQKPSTLKIMPRIIDHKTIKKAETREEEQNMFQTTSLSIAVSDSDEN